MSSQASEVPWPLTSADVIPLPCALPPSSMTVVPFSEPVKRIVSELFNSTICNVGTVYLFIIQDPPPYPSRNGGERLALEGG